MSKTAGSFAQLGGDHVVRFLDAEHFLRELTGNLGRGRAVVRTRRPFAVEDHFRMEIEAPGVDWRVPCEARVVVVRDGFVGLEILRFSDEVQPELDELGTAAEANLSAMPAEKTVIAPMPTLPRALEPEALDPGALGPAKGPLLGGRRRRPRPLAQLPADPTEPRGPNPPYDEGPELDADATNQGLPAQAEADPSRLATVEDDDLGVGLSADKSALISVASDTPRPVLALDELVVLEPSVVVDRAIRPPLFEAPLPPDASTQVGELEGHLDLAEEVLRPVQVEAPSSDDLAFAEFGEDDATAHAARPRGETVHDTPAPEAPPRVVSSGVIRDPAEDLAAPVPTARALEPAAPSTLGSAVPVTADPAEAPAAAEVMPAPPAAPPPLPQVALQNLEALADKHPATPHVTRGGVLRVTDAGTLLGLYLSQLRHGRLTVWGPLEGEPGDEVRLKIVGHTVVSLPTEIVGRVGEWVTLAVPSAEPVAAVLADAAADWRPILDAVAPPPPAAAPPPPAPAPESDALPAAVASTPPPPSSDAELPRATQGLPEPVFAPAPPPEEDDGPPELPRLAGDRVVFRRNKDLAHEIEANLKNGGLFVDSGPLPIRTKRLLTVQVGAQSWEVGLQADVVFASGGRVGFSVVNAAEAVRQLEERLAGGGAASLDEDDEPDFDVSAAGATSDMSAYIGTIQRPLNDAQVLGLDERRIDDFGAVERTTVLQLLEHVVGERWKGVLKLESGANHVVAWLHEGSVAFVSARPYDEASSVGRILVNQKKLSEAGLREALEKSKAGKKSLGRALVALGHVKKSDLSAALREQMRMKLEEALGFDHGQYEWTPWRAPPGDADLVLTRGVGSIAHHIRSRFEALHLADIEALFAKNLGRPVGHDGDLDQATQGMHLQPRELRFLELQLDGRRSLEDAVRGSPVGRLASLRLVAMGLALGFVRFTDGTSAPREATRFGMAPSHFESVKRDLKEALHRFRGMNHFDVLGVHWSAHHRSFKQAFDQVKRQYDAAGPGLKDAPVEVKALVREVNQVIDAAFGTLQDARRRIDYRKQLFDATERQYAADMLVKQGEVALMRGDRVGAIEALETAVELDPSQRNRQLLSTAREGRR